MTIYYEYLLENGYAELNLSHAAYLISFGREVQAAEAGHNTNEISFFLKKTAGCDYDLRCVVYTSGGTIRATSDTIDASTLSTTGAWVTFSGFSLSLNIGDYTMCEAFGSTGSAGCFVARNNAVSGNAFECQGSYTNFSSYGHPLTVKYAGTPAPSAGGARLTPPPIILERF